MAGAQGGRYTTVATIDMDSLRAVNHTTLAACRNWDIGYRDVGIRIVRIVLAAKYQKCRQVGFPRAGLPRSGGEGGATIKAADKDSGLRRSSVVAPAIVRQARKSSVHLLHVLEPW